jgi:aspartate racemase
MMTKIVGMIGGIGPESTVEYYRLLIAAYRERKGDGSYPRIIINSIDLQKLVDLVTANELAELTDYLTVEVLKLAGAGADFAILAANTPHIVFAELRRRAALPLFSIVEAACDAARALRLQRLGLFGTRFTMRAGFYQELFSEAGIALVTPDDAEQDYIHDKYMNELLKGLFLAGTRERLLGIGERLKEREGIEGLILGGTELPLILRETDAEELGIPFLDTTRIHVESIIPHLLS